MRQQGQNDAVRCDSPRRSRRKPVRRDPEKRRQQNLLAQRKYREKNRERLERLEALAASAVQTQTVESAAPTLADPSSASTNDRLFPANESSDKSVSSWSGATPIQLYDFFPRDLAIWDSPTHDPQTGDVSSTLHAWDSGSYIDPSILYNKQSNDQQTEWINLSCGCSSPHFQMRMQRPTPFGPTGTKVLRLGPGSAMPNLYANHIRMEVVCTMDALYTLGMHIGITEELLCADESISPFFRFSADATDDSMEATMIKSVQAIFKTLKPDMRPSREQISIKHHPCVDIIPFPTLRNNLIRHQADIDEDEFLVDMLTGLVCWGGAGLSRRDRQEASCISTGTPWDSRSWEAKEWFLQKYWALIGGEDSELARQTDWWRNMRGDDIEVSS